MSRFFVLFLVFLFLSYRIAAQSDAQGDAQSGAADNNIQPVENADAAADADAVADAEDAPAPEDGAEEAAEPAPPRPKRDFPYRLSLKTSAGFFYGQSEEIVYWWDTRNGHSNDKLSQLLWDMKALYYMSTELVFEPQKPFEKWGVFSHVKTSFGFPGPTGKMEDRDWDDETARKTLTIFSSHNNVTTGAFLFNAGLGVSIPVMKALVKPFVSFDLMYFSWSGNDGHGTYLGQTMAFFGPVITYTQTWYIVSPGVAFTFRFSPLVELNASLKITPLIWCFDVDNHHLRQIQFLDELRWGLLVEPAAELTFSPYDRLSLFFAVSAKEINGTRGITTRQAITGGPANTVNNQNANIINAAGAGYHVVDLALGVKIRLL